MRPQKITFGEMRSGGGGILVYCADYRCSHSIEMSADRWGDDVRLSDIEPRFVCKACGKRDADALAVGFTAGYAFREHLSRRNRRLAQQYSLHPAVSAPPDQRR